MLKCEMNGTESYCTCGSETRTSLTGHNINEWKLDACDMHEVVGGGTDG